ncbi:MAG TPA: DUF4922 domain-containing protein [Candidatus Norongarragalinales archaeon]|jgi:hypothetical protein|nr:DUF4922 domain-containing protein [Candidatus Norongarragalinales archaeon]
MDVLREWLEATKHLPREAFNLHYRYVVPSSANVPPLLVVWTPYRVNRFAEAHNDKCPLCTKGAHSQELFKGKYAPFKVFPNKYPASLGHTVIVHEKHVEKNVDAQELSVMQRFCRETGYRVVRNMRGAGASLPSHEHFQGFLERMPVENFSRKRVAEKTVLEGYPCRHFAAEGDEAPVKAAAFIAGLKEPYTVTVCPELIVVFPFRKASGPDAVGAIHASGMATYTKRSDFDNATFESLAADMADTIGPA